MIVTFGLDNNKVFALSGEHSSREEMIRLVETLFRNPEVVYADMWLDEYELDCSWVLFDELDLWNLDKVWLIEHPDTQLVGTVVQISPDNTPIKSFYRQEPDRNLLLEREP